jgi:predicted nucleic-acid-binding Zn-ribbon protein
MFAVFLNEFNSQLENAIKFDTNKNTLKYLKQCGYTEHGNEIERFT